MLHPNAHLRGHELEMGVPHQRAGKQARFAGDLEAVADTDHWSATLCVRGDLLHDRTESGDRSCSQVISVAEPAGQDDHVRALKVVILVPQITSLPAQDLGHGVIGVVIAVRARKRHDPELHPGTADSISKSSVTGFARSFPHISVTASSAVIASYESVSMMMYLPMCTFFTALNPRVWSASLTAFPCGSSRPLRGVM